MTTARYFILLTRSTLYRPPFKTLMLESRAAHAHGRMPRLQILTIADMLDGRLPKLPPIPDRVETKAKPRRKADGDQIELLLPFESAAIRPAKGDFVDPRFDSRLFQSAE